MPPLKDTATEADHAEEFSSETGIRRDPRPDAGEGDDEASPFGPAARPGFLSGAPRHVEAVPGAYLAEVLPDLTATAKRRLRNLAAPVRVSDLVALRLMEESERPTQEDVDKVRPAGAQGWGITNGRRESRENIRLARAGFDTRMRVSLVDLLADPALRPEWDARARDRNRAARGERSYRAQRPTTFALADLLARGADMKALATLPAATETTRAASVLLVERWDAEDRRRVDAAAAETVRRENLPVGGETETVEFTSLTDLLAEPDVDEPCAIEGLLGTDGKALLAAQYKAGKTTLTYNLLRSLADGAPFLGRFSVTRPGRRVALIDDEMSRGMMRAWLRRQGIENTDAIGLVDLRGRIGTFDLLTPEVRAEWVERLRGYDIVVFDCLRPALDALGLSEDKEASRFLVMFDAVLRDAGVGEAVVIDHMGHGGDRARGDSAKLGWSEENWRLLRKGEADDSPRTFASFGRVSNVAEGELRIDPENDHLVYVSPDEARAENGGEKTTTATNSLLEQVRHKVTDRPLNHGEAVTHLVGLGFSQKAARSLVEELLIKGALVERRQGRARLLHLGVDPLAPPENLVDNVRAVADEADRIAQRAAEEREAQKSAEREQARDTLIEEAKNILRRHDPMTIAKSERVCRAENPNLPTAIIRIARERLRSEQGSDDAA